MGIQIALLRGINVGGHNKVAMADLRALLETLGFANVKSLLQSGNLVFESAKLKGAALEERLESETAKRLKVSADYMVRSAAELKKVIAENPFPQAAKDDPSHLLAVFLKSAPPAKSVAELQRAIKGRELIQLVGSQLYAVYPDGIGRSKLTGTLIEQKLGVRGTGRNWNTVLKLAILCE